MGLTMWRWSAGVAVACAAVACALLPFPPADDAGRWIPAIPAPLAAEVQRLTGDLRRTQDAVRAYRSQIGLARWRSAAAESDRMSIRLDQSVPARLVGTVKTIVAEQWAALGPATSRNAEVFIYVDSTTIPRAATAAGSRRPVEPRGLVDVSFALPAATDGARCVALVRLRGTSEAHVAALRQQSVVGVCGFFAAFGLPGEGVRAWLTSTDYGVARRSDWHVAIAPAFDPFAIYTLGDEAGRCLTGEPKACRDVLRLEDPEPNHTGDRSPAASVLFHATSAGGPGRSRSTLGTAETEVLMTAVREFGVERFGQFWRASARPDAAFLAATGVPLDAWMRRWLARTYGDVPTRPGVQARDVLWLGLALPALLIAGARPRERVLAERLFSRPGGA